MVKRGRTKSRQALFGFSVGIILHRLIWLGLMVFLAIVPSANAETLPAEEKQKIEAMIERVRSLEKAQFIRNESSYDARAAAIFLRRKWKANESSVQSAREFIDKVASFSGTSGKPYRIRFADGKEMPSKVYLLEELNKLEENARG